MTQFNIRLCAPTSTTKKYAVASRFSGNDGIIITLNNDTWSSAGLTLWNCSWSSNYSAEDERVFCGGEHPIKIENVKIISTQKHFKKYFKSLYYFDMMISGNFEVKQKINIDEEDVLFLTELIDLKLCMNGLNCW